MYPLVAIVVVVEKMAFGSVETIATLLLFFWFRLQRARRCRVAHWRINLLAFEIIDRVMEGKTF